jgi:hypothetical protein
MMVYSFEVWAQRWLDAAAPGRDTRPDFTFGDDHRSEPASEESGHTEPVAGDSRPELSVVIVNWNTLHLTRACLRSLQRHLAGISHEVIVVDNASGDGSQAMIAADFPEVRLIRNPANVGFGVANNQAMKVARGRWFMLLNSDTELTDDSVARLFERVREDTTIGVAHCQLRFPDGRLQHTAYRFPTIPLAVFEDLGFYKLMPRLAPRVLLSGYWDYSHERDVDWVAGAFMLLPREVFEHTGGFDERLFMYGEDMEWCYRIRDLGRPIRYFPTASILHVDHASSEMRWGDERIALCLRRQRDIYAERHGSGHASVLMSLRVVGATLRSAYYEIRGRLGGEGAQPYRDMAPYLRSTLRALIGLAFRRS